jgi:hypothetical protein
MSGHPAAYSCENTSHAERGTVDFLLCHIVSPARLPCSTVAERRR